MKKLFIGLMGVTGDHVLVTPSGKNLFRVPRYFAIVIQHLQHWIAQR